MPSRPRAQLVRPGGVIAFDNVLWRGQARRGAFHLLSRCMPGVAVLRWAALCSSASSISQGLCILSTLPTGLVCLLACWQVADPEAQDKQTSAMRELNEFLLRDERVDFCLVPIGDGMAMCRRR